MDLLYTCMAAIVGTLIGLASYRRRNEAIHFSEGAFLREPTLERSNFPLVSNVDLEKTGEKKDFVGRGKKYVADFGENAYEMFYHVSNKLTFRELHGLNNSQTVDLEINKLRDNLFLINWEQGNGALVSQIVDFDYKTIYSVSISPDKKLTKLNGSLRVIS